MAICEARLHCGCRMLGHGIEAEGSFYCCVRCTRESGVTAAIDRA